MPLYRVVIASLRMKRFIDEMSGLNSKSVFNYQKASLYNIDSIDNVFSTKDLKNSKFYYKFQKILHDNITYLIDNKIVSVEELKYKYKYRLYISQAFVLIQKLYLICVRI